jgi:hypothetical protein
MRFFCKKNKKVYGLPFTVYSFCTQKARKIQNKFSYRHVDEQVYFTKHFVTIRGKSHYATEQSSYDTQQSCYDTWRGHYDTERGSYDT